MAAKWIEVQNGDYVRWADIKKLSYQLRGPSYDDMYTYYWMEGSNEEMDFMELSPWPEITEKGNMAIAFGAIFAVIEGTDEMVLEHDHILDAAWELYKAEVDVEDVK